MNLNEEDLVHCHKVISSDIDECSIIIQGRDGARKARLEKRIDDDKRILSRIEGTLGYVPEWEIITETEVVS